MKEEFVMKSGQAAAGEMEKINRYTRREYRPEEVYTFSLVLCDNEVDRDFERFSPAALEKLRELFLGKTCILDHERKSANQTARIFDTALETEEGRVTRAGEPYQRLTARAYLPKTEKNRETIELIESGILKEVSISCAVKRSVCSLCGKESCSHQKGREYGGKLCCRVLEDPADAYECSFVAVPNEDMRKEKTMENKTKPRICEVLGVEVREVFTADYPYKDLGKMEVREDGNIDCVTGHVRSNALCYMINHPECIHKVCRWTPEEVELAKAVKLMFPNSYSLLRVCNSHEEWIRISRKDGLCFFTTLEAYQFPSLKRGETVLISDIIGGDGNG